MGLCSGLPFFVLLFIQLIYLFCILDSFVCFYQFPLHASSHLSALALTSFPHGLVLNLFIFLAIDFPKFFWRLKQFYHGQRTRPAQMPWRAGTQASAICSPWVPPCSDPSLLTPSSPSFLVPPSSSADSLGAWVILELSRAIHRSEQDVPQSEVFHPF